MRILHISMPEINLFESVISVQGKIFWNDHRRRIDLKKPVRDIFEPLENRSTVYVMEICLSKDKVMARTKELLENGIVPILFYFKKSDEVCMKQNALSVEAGI